MGQFEILLKFLFGEIYFYLIQTELQVFNNFSSGKGKGKAVPLRA
jgi:hypothetical protein